MAEDSDEDDGPCLEKSSLMESKPAVMSPKKLMSSSNAHLHVTRGLQKGASGEAAVAAERFAEAADYFASAAAALLEAVTDQSDLAADLVPRVKDYMAKEDAMRAAAGVRTDPSTAAEASSVAQDVNWDKRFALSIDQRCHFQHDGFLHVPGVVSLELVAAALRDINTALFNAAQAGVDLISTSGATTAPGMRAFNDGTAGPVVQFTTTPAVMDLLFCSGAWTIAQNLLGRGQIQRPIDAQVAVRPPEPALLLGESRAELRNGVTDDGKRWHLDGMTQPGQHSPFSLLLGVALSDQPAGVLGGNLIVFPGSHRALQPLVAQSMRSGACASQGLFPMGEGPWKTKPDLGPGYPLEVAAGDVVLCHQKLAHRGGANGSAHLRYMVYFRLSHVRHDALASTGATVDDLWCEFEGLTGSV